MKDHHNSSKHLGLAACWEDNLRQQSVMKVLIQNWVHT